MDKTIALLGDSLAIPGFAGADPAQHWFTLATAASGYAPANVTRFAASGDTTDEGLLRVPSIVTQAPNVCVIMLMANDRAAVPIARYESNLRSIITQLQLAGIKVVLASCPVWKVTPIDYVPFLNVMQELALEYGCRYIDVFREYAYILYANASAATPWYYDNIHQTTAGNIKMKEIFDPFISANWINPA